MCPKLSRQYPLKNIECVDKSLHKCESPKVEVVNCRSFDTPNGVHVDESHVELAGTQPDICSEEESSELGLEFSRSWEFEQAGTQITDVQGHLCKNVNFWEQELEAEWIKEGYKLPLFSLPGPYKRSNHRSALENSKFVNIAMMDFVKNRCVLEMGGIPHICSPLSVVSNSTGKKRLVIDLRYLNQHFIEGKF